MVKELCKGKLGYPIEGTVMVGKAHIVIIFIVNLHFQ